MLTLKNARDWLATLFLTDFVSAGFLDANRTQCLAVYQRDTGGWNQAIGSESTYQRFYGKVLVHWGSTEDVCDAKALAVFNTIKANRSHYIDVQMERPPFGIGRDDNGIFEAIVLFTIIYEME